MARRTRKHFQERAGQIRQIASRYARLLAAQDATDYFATTNPRFDRQRFMAACGIDTYA